MTRITKLIEHKGIFNRTCIPTTNSLNVTVVYSIIHGHRRSLSCNYSYCA
jgi:hypothetical protein